MNGKITKYDYQPTHRVLVGAYVFDSKNRMLLLLRNDPPKVYAPPGGRLHPNENPVKGIIREVSEETGITIKLLDMTFIWFGEIEPDSPYILSIDFLAVAETTEVKLSAEHSDYLWVEEDDIRNGNIITQSSGYGYDPEIILKAFTRFKELQSYVI